MINALNGAMLDLLILKITMWIEKKIQDEKIAEDLDYRGINFPMKVRYYEIIEERFNINVNIFGYGNRFFSIICINKI